MMSIKSNAIANSRQYSRYHSLIWVAGLFLVINFFIRLGLMWYDGGISSYSAGDLFQIFAVGLVYDLAAFVWFSIPFSVIAWIVPGGPKGRLIHGVMATGLFMLFISGVVFQSVSEFIFWNEFSARFNFIAVDYLVYTREVVGNIQQSYPVNTILTGVFIVTILLLAFSIRKFWHLSTSYSPRFKVRSLVFLVSISMPAMVFFGLDESLHDHMRSPAMREVASNGTYSFFRALRNNQLDYPTYYSMLEADTVQKVLKEELQKSGKRYIPPSKIDRANFMNRHIQVDDKQLNLNIVLVSIESLGSDYVDAFDGHRGLTPNLDKLANESLIFTNLYATGLRTVRGLEAITLSIPPTPGRAVPMREYNKGLQSLGGVLKEHGYDPYYFYGGYSIFDNMNDFFSGNGYTVIDRTDIPDEKITHETIWGVADEDLYSLVLRKLDERVETTEKPFFAHIMTTSNHRPYTYPEGRVSIPSHTGRNGAVQYTDWAIGEFMRQVRQRSWFNNTVFVFVADHTSHGRGRIDLPPENYRIPMIIHAPGMIKPGKLDTVASQIDIAPTLLSLLNIEYDSELFGQDILSQGPNHSRAFMANYLTVGYMENDRIVELGPQKHVRVVNAQSGDVLDQSEAENNRLIEEAISYYQAASSYIAGDAKK